MAFAPQFLDEIRQRLSLAGVVGQRVKLSKRGRDYIGLCPFHKEKTPSFNVVEDKAFYHCFGCGAHGDVIGFTMRVENLGFRESVEQLAHQAGLELPVETPAARAEAARATTLNEACAAAADVFEKQLWSPSGAAALAYLRERGLSEDLIRKFRLGWAPDNRSFLKGALGGRFPEALLVEAGLLRQGEQGAFDFFRGRVIFPIFDRSGRVIAFGGRTLGDGQPKYLNSPDTPIFHKGRTLYGLHLARGVSGPEAPPIVTEGYMDVIALHGAGFATAVAPLGTALTEEHLGELWRVHAEPVVCFDGDTAGQRAAVRTLDRALPQLTTERSLLFVQLPEKHDPDSLIRTNGPEAFARLLKAALSLSRFLWTSARAAARSREPDELFRIEALVRKRAAKIPDPDAKYAVLKSVSALLWTELRRYRRLDRDPSRHPSVGARLEALLPERGSAHHHATVMVCCAVNHPDIAIRDIDRFVAVEIADSQLLALREAVIGALESLEAPDRFQIADFLERRNLGGALSQTLRSNIYLMDHSIHERAPLDRAALTWRAAFSRTQIPALRLEYEKAQADRQKNPSDTTAWDREKVMLALLEEAETEAELTKLAWDADVIPWEPGSPSTSVSVVTAVS